MLKVYNAKGRVSDVLERRSPLWKLGNTLSRYQFKSEDREEDMEACRVSWSGGHSLWMVGGWLVSSAADRFDCFCVYHLILPSLFGVLFNEAKDVLQIHPTPSLRP